MANVQELRERLKELGVDPDSIQGSGQGGNVLKVDLEKALADAEAAKRGGEGLDSGAKRGSRGQYLPARYKTLRGIIREDR